MSGKADPLYTHEDLLILVSHSERAENQKTNQGTVHGLDKPILPLIMTAKCIHRAFQ